MNKWLSFVTMFAPIILSLFGVNPIVGQLVVDGIVTEETVRGSGTGKEKKAAVITGVATGLTALNDARVASGKTPIADPAAVSSQVGSAIDLVVSVVNEVHGKAPVVPTVVPVVAVVTQ